MDLWQVPVVQCHYGSDLVLQQTVDQVVVVLDSFLVHMISCRDRNIDVTQVQP